MKTRTTAIIITAFLGLALLASVSCKTDEVSQPANPIGPSSIGVMMNVVASPNVILVGVKQRQVTNVMATLKKYDGTAQSGRTVLFEIVDASLNRVDVGYFEGNASVFTRTTDSGGNAHVILGLLFLKYGRDHESAGRRAGDPVRRSGRLRPAHHSGDVLDTQADLRALGQHAPELPLDPSRSGRPRSENDPDRAGHGGGRVAQSRRRSWSTGRGSRDSSSGTTRGEDTWE